MSVVKHIPDTSPEPTGTSCLGYPRGTWPPLTSSYCANPSRDNERHKDCSLQGVLASATPIGDKARNPRETRLRLTTSSSGRLGRRSWTQGRNLGNLCFRIRHGGCSSLQLRGIL